MMHDGATGLLIAVAVGYWVLERADTHKKGMRQLGRLIGFGIILVSVIGIACKVWCVAGGACAKGSWGMRGSYCPFSSKIPMGAPPESR